MPHRSSSRPLLSAEARRVDAELHEVAASLSFLLAVTPINVDEEWQAFVSRRMRGTPNFRYRPSSPALAEHLHRVDNLPVSKVHDAGVHELLVEQREGLHQRLKLLELRNRPRFMELSKSLFGVVDDDLLHLAKGLLIALDEPQPELDEDEQGAVGARELHADARALAHHYQQEIGDTQERCVLTPEVEGVLVSNGKLYINSRLRVSHRRKAALLAHEVGTHLLTYLNATLQPLQVLASGLTGYDELQEGLAVLAEYVVGGLSRHRMRVLAARVIAVRALVEQHEFEDVFHLLRDTAALSERECFVITMRVFRGGGLTKDVVYLRGLCRLLKYLGHGGDLTPLLVGKIGLSHLALIELLLAQGTLHPPRLIPLHLTAPPHRARVDTLGQGLSVMDLIERRSP